MARITSLSRGAALIALVIMTVGAQLAFSQPRSEKNPAPVIPAASDEPGVLVVSVDPSSPAGTAGIVRGDIILSVNGKDIAGAADLNSVIAQVKIGDRLELKIKHGDVERAVSVTLAERNGAPYLGIAPLFGGRFGNMPFGSFVVEIGASVVSVVEGSPAEKAGLKVGDRIEAVDGTKLDNGDNNLAALIAKKKIGDAVTLSVRTGDAEARDVSIVLDKNPQKPESPYLGVQYMPFAGMPGLRMMEQMPFFNKDRSPTTPDGTTAPTPASGVRVVSVLDGSPAATAGLKANDVISAIDGIAVNSANVVADTVAKHKPGDVLELTISRADDKNAMTEQKISVVLGKKPQGEGSEAAYLGVTMSIRMLQRRPNAPSTRNLENPRTLITPRQGSDT
jgi:S1-C subfamily serine protease